MIRSIIIDDEKHCREYLAELILHYCPEIEVVGEASNVDEAVILVGKRKPNLLFIDIQMPGKNGFALLEEKNIKDNPSIKAIFTTAYDQYAIKALRYAAIDYLLKPIDKDELTEAVLRYQELVKNVNFQSNLELIRQFNKTHKLEKICLPSRQEMVFVKISEIQYLEAQGSYTVVHLNNSKSVCVSKPIISFENMLPVDQFLRVHRSFIVNINRIRAYNSVDNCIILDENLRVEVSVRKKQDLLKALSIYQQPR